MIYVYLKLRKKINNAQMLSKLISRKRKYILIILFTHIFLSNGNGN